MIGGGFDASTGSATETQPPKQEPCQIEDLYHQNLNGALAPRRHR